jgi:hypothetical protein
MAEANQNRLEEDTTLKDGSRVMKVQAVPLTAP